MQAFIYPQDYLGKKGSISHCWEVHVKRMKEIGKPYVDYNSFYTRIKRQEWDLYKAIHTPLSYTRLSLKQKVCIWIRTQWFRFIYLFKGHDRVKRSEGHKHLSKS